MKSITEIIGTTQRLLDVSFDIQDLFEEYLSTDQRTFLHILLIIEADLTLVETLTGRRGRPAYRKLPFLRSYLGKSFFKIDTTEELISRLKSDANFRMMCGFTAVASPATFSRRFGEFAQKSILDGILNDMVHRYLGDQLIGHISRDSTAIVAREKAQNQKREVALRKEPKRRRGRPRKGESRPQKKLKRLQRQLRMRPGKALRELDTACAWGCKKNSQGNVSFWKGYKLHLDVTDTGIPVTAVLTGANVHDSQAAIPMEKLTERRVSHLYSLMDSAYDAPEISAYIRGKGRVDLIDANKRRKKDVRQFDPAQAQRYKIRSTVERANAHLKDWFFGSKLMVRGHKKVSFHLMCGVVCLTAVKILQQIILPTIDAQSG